MPIKVMLPKQVILADAHRVLHLFTFQTPIIHI